MYLYTVGLEVGKLTSEACIPCESNLQPIKYSLENPVTCENQTRSFLIWMNLYQILLLRATHDHPPQFFFAIQYEIIEKK